MGVGDTLSAIRRFWLSREPAALVTSCQAPVYRQQPDRETLLRQACDCIRQDMESDDAYCLPCFCPDYGTVSTAAMWGGAIIPAREGQCIHIQPVATSVAGVATLQPQPFEATDFQRGLDDYREVCRRLGCDDLAVRLPDFQGPMNTLALLMDQTELMCALYEQPAAVHAVLDGITDKLIATVRRFYAEAGTERIAGMIWPYIVLPGDLGVCITQDYMPLLGPDLYAEFELPRLKRIADAFGGVFIHCCGEYRQHLPALRTADFKIWGLEAHYPHVAAWDLYATFGTDIACVAYVAPMGAAEFPTLPDCIRRIAQTPARHGRYWIPMTGAGPDVAAMRELVASHFGRGGFAD